MDEKDSKIASAEFGYKFPSSVCFLRAKSHFAVSRMISRIVVWV
jgi:hypothetical protein